MRLDVALLLVALPFCLSARPMRIGLDAGAPKAPVWPERLEVSYTLELPYVSSVQPGGLRYPVSVMYDGPGSSAVMDFYDGLDATYILPDFTYNIYPRISTKVCEVLNTTTGPTGPALQDSGSLLPPPLPDISGWEYAGKAHLPGKEASFVWQLTQRNWEKVSTYTFHVAQETGAPLVLNMVGVNLVTGSHYDQYEITFTHFKPISHARKNAFEPPQLCTGGAVVMATPDTHHARRLQALSLLPASLVPAAAAAAAAPSSSSISSREQSIHADTDAAHPVSASDPWQQRIPAVLLGLSGGADSSSSEHARIQSDLDFITRWNAQAERLSAGGPGGHAGPSFRLAPNKFLPLPEQQWRAGALGSRRPVQPAGAAGAHRLLRNAARLEPFKRMLTDEQLPQAVDWRGTGADGPVKDQASCGSCWAFATAGAMTGAWFQATGSSISLSEQQLVDCSWDSGDYGNNGCGGGWTESALAYAAGAGVASESDYEYLGQNGYCRENKTEKVAKFKGFMAVPYKDEKAMMEAVATYGPIAISYDAGDITMKYYSEGVYYREDCGNDADHLDHAVTLVGYGTTPGGVDYWLLRNSWSVLWGESGYIKVARKGNDCGITVDGVIAVVDPEAAAAAAREDAAQRVAAARAMAIKEMQPAA